MGRKKQELQGNVIEISMPVEEVAPVPESETVKKKKPITDKQRENLSRGMAILKAKREAKAKEVESTVATIPSLPSAETQESVAIPPESPKPRKPRVIRNIVTKDDFNQFRTELLNTLTPLTRESNVPPQRFYQRPQQPQQPQQTEPQQQPQAPVITSPPVVPPLQIRERLISGRELLDKIFFK